MPHCSTGGMPAFVLKRMQSLIDNKDFELFVVEYADLGGRDYVQKNYSNFYKKIMKQTK